MSNYSKRNNQENVHDPDSENYVAEFPCPRCNRLGDVYDKKLDEWVPCENCDGYGTILDNKSD